MDTLVSKSVEDWRTAKAAFMENRNHINIDPDDAQRIFALGIYLKHYKAGNGSYLRTADAITNVLGKYNRG